MCPWIGDKGGAPRIYADIGARGDPHVGHTHEGTPGLLPHGGRRECKGERCSTRPRHLDAATRPHLTSRHERLESPGNGERVPAALEFLPTHWAVLALSFCLCLPEDRLCEREALRIRRDARRYRSMCGHCPPHSHEIEHVFE